MYMPECINTALSRGDISKATTSSGTASRITCFHGMQEMPLSLAKTTSCRRWATGLPPRHRQMASLSLRLVRCGLPVVYTVVDAPSCDENLRV